MNRLLLVRGTGATRDRSGKLLHDFSIHESELTASAGIPRMAAIEHPFGLAIGLPGDESRQFAVLQGALGALVEISRPGETVHLRKVNTQPPELPPIARYLVRHPWQLPKFLNRAPPEKTQTSRRRAGSEAKQPVEVNTERLPELLHVD